MEFPFNEGKASAGGVGVLPAALAGDPDYPEIGLSANPPFKPTDREASA